MLWLLLASNGINNKNLIKSNQLIKKQLSSSFINKCVNKLSLDDIKHIRQYQTSLQDSDVEYILETAPWISNIEDVLQPPFNNLVDVNLDKQTIIYEVTLNRNLSIEFAQANGYVYISSVYPNSNAEGLGIKPNDVILAISATAGDKLWFHGTVEGLVSALSTRFVMSESVTLQLERPLSFIDNDLKKKLKIPLIQTVRIKRPIGIHVHEGSNKGVFIQYIKPGHGAALSNRVKIGDQVVGLSASWGDRLWDIDSVESFIVSVGMRSDPYISLKLKRMVPIDTFVGVSISLSNDVNQKRIVQKETDSILIEKIESAVNVDEIKAIWMSIRNDTKNYFTYYCNFYINKLMTACLKLGDESAAIDIFEKTYCYQCNDVCDEGTCLVPNTFACTTVVKAYGNRNESDKILSILQFLDSHGKHHADSAFFSALIKELTKLHKFEEVERLIYSEIPLRNISANAVISNSLFNLYARLEKGKGTIEMYQLMKQQGINLNTASYSTLFKVLLHYDKESRNLAFSILSSLPSSILTLEIFNQFLEAYYITRNYGKLKIILRMMNKEKIDLDNKGYGYVINLLAEINKPKVALNVLDDMKRRGILANKHCYMGALKAMRILCDAGGTVQTLVEMNENGLYPELPHYTVAMFACITGNQYTLVETIFDSIIKSSCQPDTAIYTFLLQSLLEQGKWDQGLELFEKMKVGEVVPSANSYTFSYMLKFCILNKEYNYAKEVLDYMITKYAKSSSEKMDLRVIYTNLLEVIPSSSRKYEQKEIEFKSLRELNYLSVSMESLGFLISLCEALGTVPEFFYVELLSCLVSANETKYIKQLLDAKLNGRVKVDVTNSKIKNKEKLLLD